MLSGVAFRKNETTGQIQPEFVNQFVLTDVYLNTLASPKLRVPILPSIATLVNPVASFIWITLRIMRTILLVILSHLPGSKQAIKRISVANTNVVYHDGRALATCESGPPIRIQLPGLETVGWYDGASAEGEPKEDGNSNEITLGHDSGLISFMREWTTAHPKVDPTTKEMLMFHSSFAPPYVQYSIVPKSSDSEAVESGMHRTKILNAAVPGVTSAKMMHDFGVSPTYTVIMDLPLSLDPINQLKGLPPVTYSPEKPSRFGVFPRRQPELVQWFETDASCIFHTANTWDDVAVTGVTSAVNMLACRLTSATLVFAAGNIAPPLEKLKAPPVKARRRMPFFAKYDPATDGVVQELESPIDEKEPLLSVTAMEEAEDDELFEEDQCRLYYYHFDLAPRSISHQWALSSIPFEFPSVRPDLEMQNAQYIYGCSTTTTSFGSALGKATKIDALVKIDAQTLIERGRRNPPPSVTGVVDSRNMQQVLQSHDNVNDPIRVFRMPEGWFAQEPRFVPASNSKSEDDGYLLFYAFDEDQLNSNGDVPADTSPLRAKSELWIINAKNMTDVVARIHLPQRVPYGLHGTWFTAEEIAEQKPVESLRTTAKALEAREEGCWMSVRSWVEGVLG
jgi:carotenoid cleavage dioxygenase-like enzyme